MPELPPKRGIKRDETLTLVMTRFSDSDLYQQSFIARTRRWYDLYRGISSRNFQSFRNNIHIPFIFSVIQSDVSRKVQTSLGTWPIVSFSGYGMDDEQNARRNEILVSAQMKDADTFTKAVDFFLQADLYGTAVCRVGWKTKRQMQKFRHVIPETNTESVGTVEVTKFDGPDWSVIDLPDFFPQPGIRAISDMMWCIHRYWMDLDKMKETIDREKPDESYFIPSALAELDKYPATTSSPSLTPSPFSYPSTLWEARRNEKFAKPVEIKEMVGWVPDEFAIGGANLVIIAVANDRVIVKYDAFPFWHGDLASVFIKYCPMPAPHEFHGTGMAEICEKMQITTNRLASQKLDALEIAIDPPIFANESLGLTGPIWTRAGKVNTVNGMLDDSNFRQFQPDLRGLQGAYAEINSLWSWMQQGTGQTDLVMGLVPEGGRETARGVLARQENAVTRIGLSSRLAEEAWLEPLANTFRYLNRQYLTLPHSVKILGPSGFVNPYTGQVLPPEPVIIDLEDVNPDYRARAVGASQMLTKSMRQQNYMGLLGVIGQVVGTVGQIDPTVVTTINWLGILREGFQLFDFKNLNELFTNIPAVAQTAATNGRTPDELMAELSRPQLETLSPELLGSQPAGPLSNL